MSEPSTREANTANGTPVPPTDIARVVSELRTVLPTRVIAFIASRKQTDTVRRWAKGLSMPNHDVSRRLRAAWEAARILSQQESPTAVRAWFLCMNPELNDWSPAAVLSEEPADSAAVRVVAAARAFTAYPHDARTSTASISAPSRSKE